jgi:hypothetical protein
LTFLQLDLLSQSQVLFPHFLMLSHILLQREAVLLPQPIASGVANAPAISATWARIPSPRAKSPDAQPVQLFIGQDLAQVEPGRQVKLREPPLGLTRISASRTD